MSGHSTRQLRLKAATRALQDGVGGLGPATEIAGKSTSQHGRYRSEYDPDFAPIDVVIALEAVARRDASWPPVTRLLCQLAGGVFLPLPDVDACDSGVALEMCGLLHEFGDLAGVVRDGMADGSLDAGEALRALREGQELMAKLAAFNRMLEAMVEAGGGPSLRHIREAGGAR